MLNFILEFSVRRRPMVWLGVVLTAVLGIGAALRLPMDAVPDITSPQVQINTGVDGLAPEEIEKQVTVPIEHEMSGIPGMTELRSLSKSGLSQVTMIFQDGTDLYRARQLVSERLQQVAAELPDGLTPRLAPFATGLGEIYYYSLDYAPGAAPEGTSRREQLMALRWIHDSMVRPLLRQTPGLAEVNTSGGYERTHTVVPDLARMTAAGVAIGDLASVLMENTRNAGGGAVELGGELITVRANTRASGPADLGNLTVKFAGGVQPVRVRDLATLTVGTRFRTGASTEDGREALVGSAIMMAGENSRIVADAVRERLEAIQAKLPKGLILRTLYDRSHLVDRTLHTVERNLTEGALLVIAVLFVLLGNLRGAFIVALAIPLSMLFAMIGMVQLQIPGNLMSLGAIDFGLIIDGAVVMVENILRRLGGRQHEAGRPLTAAERVETVLLASKEVARPMVFGVLIITAVYGPVLALQGIEGKMFRPMAIVVMLALGGSLVLALTLMPALCAAWLTGPVAEKDNWAVGAAKRIYSPLLAFGLRHRMAILIPVVVLVAGSAHVFTRLGAEFIPELDEGDGILQLVKAQSAGLEASIAMQVRSEQVLLAAFPEIDRIFCRMGSAEIATDPMDPGDADTYIMLKPRDTWRSVDGRRRTKEQLLEAMQKTLEQNVPGQAVMINQPIQMRFDEIMAGARAELSLKIYGEDLAMLETLAEKSREVLRGIRGAADVELDKIGRTPQMQIMQDRTATERLNLHAGEINRAVELALGGEELGFLQEGGRRVPVRIQLAEADRSNPDAIRRISIRTDGGNLLTLGRVITVSNLTQVGTLHRENGQRRVSILINVRGRDTESFVQEAGERLKAAVPLPEGCWMEFGGQFRNLVEAKRRLAIVVPIALGLILFFMYLSFSSLRQALLVFVCVPLATTGGVIALAMRDMPFTLSAGVGFIALSGIAVLNGIMLVSFINQLRAEGRGLREAVLEGTLTRLRPKLMTALVASLGFVPMALSTSAGAEVQRPLATVVIGGIITSTLLTLVVIPVLYDWLERRRGADASTAAGTPDAREPKPQVP